ncbi:ribosomal RNA small subunit methyltransferase, chloroplastic isoform X2 [Beta vulgaris subsp. vulgaris]|uniref:ribosomal RNA small subunit methyltransferase, chloroplastic isoform X2 n=1 Tax=Beta vulgaris subsp. vulgaris TaxID=3555 RepID=UPI0020376040|nr:ribosomal RNA small subunit methyltransferase, chloroplastic isoform X2 [Beta vulgaris subsp. vulgaris]
MLSFVQPFPPNPIPVTSTSKIQHNKSLYSTNLTKIPKRRRTLFIISAANPDDYNATLKALNSRKRFPRKSLGQHYMLNSTINEQLASVANVKDGDLVLEIGPGTGSLTNVLTDAGATVLAIEKDPHMAALVKERFADTGRLMVVANIPFNISKDVVKQLLPMGDIFSEVVLLLQDETAIRLVESSSKSSEYRPINIFVKFYSDPEYKFQVPRANFFPQPNVDGAVVSFKLKQPSDYPSVPSIKSFFSLVNSAFNGKRKMLRNTLQHIRTPPEIEEALRSMDLPATSRPEELTLNDFVKLHNSLVIADLDAP